MAPRNAVLHLYYYDHYVSSYIRVYNSYKSSSRGCSFMIAVGMVMLLFGYAVIYWALLALQGKTQPSFVKYVMPFGT
jgi:hypothetical protein